MEEKAAPYTVCIVETRRKKVIIWADGETDAAWKALDLLGHGVIEMDAPTTINDGVSFVRPSDDEDLKHYEQYCRGCHV